MGIQWCIVMSTDLGLNGGALYQLMSWLSPSYPVGAYTYSHGLEHAVESGWVTNASETRDWVEQILVAGDGHIDAVMLAHAYRAGTDIKKLANIIEFATAFIPSAELELESTMQGAAFLEITERAWPNHTLEQLRSIAGSSIPYPIVVGVAAAGHKVPLEATLHAYLHAFAANMVSAAVRLIPLGQTDGQLITAALADVIPAVVKSALNADLDTLSTNTLMADIGSMRHETQYTRLFRS